MNLANSKPWFQARLRPTARALARAGVTANQVTLTTMGVSAGAGIAISLHSDSATVLLLMFVVRPITVMASTRKTELKLEEKGFLPPPSVKAPLWGPRLRLQWLAYAP